MTAQVADLMVYNGSNYALLCNPLRAYFDGCHIQHPYVSTSSMNWRGYVARWKIADDKLYLSDVNGQICTRKHDVDHEPSSRCPVGHQGSCQIRSVGIDYLFDTSAGNVFADWFSGELRLPTGKMIEYKHMGYGSKYERYLIFNIENGKVIDMNLIGSADYEKLRLARLEKIASQTKPWWAFWL